MGIDLRKSLLALCVIAGCLPVHAGAAAKQAQYAVLDYDVVYVRCPRGREPVVWGNGKTLLNWNGVNDMWLSASNNIYQQPGCDLVLHHSAPDYRGLPAGDPGREEVLVDCDEEDTSQPVCTIADPNVSLDGKYVVYTKFTDTRTFVKNSGVSGSGGGGPSPHHNQSYMELSTDGQGNSSGKRYSSILKAYDAPALIYRFDLAKKTETQVSPAPAMFAGRAHPGKDSEWTSNYPVIDTSPFFRPDGRIGFTSNRANGFLRFQLFAMDIDGRNLELHGHRAMNQQLHPAVLKDGRIAYTSFDAMLQKVANNQYSLFTINPDGSFPFILAGKFDATRLSYHFVTQLSDGDIVVSRYYNKNNGGMGSLLRFPIDPPGADFEHSVPWGDLWKEGSPGSFARPGQFKLTPDASAGDSAQRAYKSNADYWTHPSRRPGGKALILDNQTFMVDKDEITMTGRYTHPAGAPDNDLLVTYSIGASSTMGGGSGPLQDILDRIGKDAGIWLIPLAPNGTQPVGHIADDGRIVVDFPEYHEIMPRAVVPYSRIYNQAKPGTDEAGTPAPYMAVHDNLGKQDPRLPAGAPYGLSGASSMYDRETRAHNGTPWNMQDGGGTMSGRNYSNLASAGAELAIFDNSEVYGIRVLLPIPSYPNNFSGGERWVGYQKHHLRILGEFPVRKTDGTLLDEQGNPDTSFILRLPADTPFLFQSLDKRGMALDIETTSRSLVRGEQQLCIGCHVHTREGMDPFQSAAKLDTEAPYGDFSGDSAPLFADLDTAGDPIVQSARSIYDETLAPGVNQRRSFAVDWVNGVADVIENRCAGCHGEGQAAQQLTGLRLDGNMRTYDLLTKSSYKREDGTAINYKTKPGDGLSDVINATPGTDRITRRYSCCLSSRWLSFNSARSSMLVWALYGDRLDGRNPQTGLPWGANGEAIPADIKAGLRGVPVDNKGIEYPEVWPKVTEHAAYVASMPEAEKRLIARWIDIGVPKLNVHDDMLRPVLTVTPVLESDSIQTVLVGLWDDSPLDYSRFKVSVNGNDVTPVVSGTPDVINVNLGVNISEANADDISISFEIWDRPNRSLSLKSPGTAAANRIRKTYTGRGLLRLVDATPNSAPTATSANILTYADLPSNGVLASVTDPDNGDSHILSIISQPRNGTAEVVNNRLVYTPDTAFTGTDRFTYKATDLGGLAVEGVAGVTVLDLAPAPGGSSGARKSDSAGGGSTAGAGGLGMSEMLFGLLVLWLRAGLWRWRRYAGFAAT